MTALVRPLPCAPQEPSQQRLCGQGRFGSSRGSVTDLLGSNSRSSRCWCCPLLPSFPLCTDARLLFVTENREEQQVPAVPRILGGCWVMAKHRSLFNKLFCLLRSLFVSPGRSWEGFWWWFCYRPSRDVVSGWLAPSCGHGDTRIGCPGFAGWVALEDICPEVSLHRGPACSADPPSLCAAQVSSLYSYPPSLVLRQRSSFFFSLVLLFNSAIFQTLWGSVCFPSFLKGDFTGFAVKQLWLLTLAELLGVSCQ